MKPKTKKKEPFTTLSRKVMMALTGLFLCFFLVIHLMGNLPLLMAEEEAQQVFNSYAQALSQNIFIRVASIILYSGFIIHIVYSAIITFHDFSSGPKYVYDQRKKASKWYSRNMGLLGTIILIFLVIHMKDFWYEYKFGNPGIDQWGHKDLYTIVVAAFGEWWYVLIYVISMVALGYHLLHGFYSAARTMGVYHPKYNLWIKRIGAVYSYTIVIGFSVIPIYLFVKQLL